MTTSGAILAFNVDNVYVSVPALVVAVLIGVRNYLVPDEMRVKYNDAKLRLEILLDDVASFRHNRCGIDESTAALVDLLRNYTDTKNKIKAAIPPISIWIEKLITIVR